MDSVIELQRQTHEEIERFEGALYDLLSRSTTVHERKLQNEHKASQVLDRITTRTTALNNLYVDGDSRKEEINRLTASKPDDLSEFYSRLVKIQEHHNKYPDSAPGIDLELASFLEEPGQEEEDLDVEDDRTFPLSTLASTEKKSAISLMFSGEEAYGKYCDLYANHVAYTNLKGIGKRPGYLQYLDLLLESPSNEGLSKETRLSKEYES